MCVVSNIGSYQQQAWSQPNSLGSIVLNGGYVTKAQFDELRAEVQALKTLLEAAKKFDEVTKQPECQDEEKVALIKAVAKAVGVDLGDVLK